MEVLGGSSKSNSCGGHKPIAVSLHTFLSKDGDVHRAATRAENDSGFTERFLEEVEWVAVTRDVKLAQDILDQRTVSLVDTVAALRHRRAQRIGGKSDVGWSR